MKQTTLADLVDQIGPSAVAKALGVSAPAITKAMKAKRNIQISEHADGTFSADELRPFPSQGKSKAA